MKLHMLRLALFTMVALLFAQCGQPETSTDKTTKQYACPMHCEKDKVYNERGECPVCHMKLMAVKELEAMSEVKEVDLSMSVFNLNSSWVNQNGEPFQLNDLGGQPFLAVMIYTSCQAACPRLVADIKNIKDSLGCEGMNYLLVSMNPEEDTPEVLHKYAQDNDLTDDCWVLFTGDKDATREFSNVISVKYRKVSETDFSHSNIISLFDEHGILNYQQEGLGVDNSELVEAIDKL